jgi:DNA-binding GntR family transcriptional regulator
MAKPETWSGALAEHLAQQIATGELPPGSPLDETRLAERHGVSRTPVREAIRHLLAIGLAEAGPRRGTLVARPDPARLAEMFAVLAELEALGAALAAERMRPGERRALADRHRDMGGLVRAGDTAGYRAANLGFHGAIADGARNAYLAELASGTRVRLAPFRGARFDTPDGMARSHAEHGEILAAVTTGERMAAAAAMRRHIARTEAALTEARPNDAAPPGPWLPHRPATTALPAADSAQIRQRMIIS